MRGVLNNDVHRLEQDLRALRERAAALEEAIQQNEELLAAVGPECARKDVLISELRGELESRDRSLAQLETQVEDLTEEAHRSQEALHRLSKENKDLESECRKMDGALRKLRSREQQQRETILDLTATVEDQSEELARLVKSTAALKGQLEGESRTTVELQAALDLAAQRVAQLRERLRKERAPLGEPQDDGNERHSEVLDPTIRLAETDAD